MRSRDSDTLICIHWERSPGSSSAHHILEHGGICAICGIQVENIGSMLLGARKSACFNSTSFFPFYSIHTPSSNTGGHGALPCRPPGGFPFPISIQNVSTNAFPPYCFPASIPLNPPSSTPPPLPSKLLKDVKRIIA